MNYCHEICELLEIRGSSEPPSYGSMTEILSDNFTKVNVNSRQLHLHNTLIPICNTFFVK